MKNQLARLPVLLLCGTLLFSACKKDSGGETNDEEVITTMEVKVTDVTASTTQTFKFDDPDGPGGSAPAIDEIVLKPNKVYTVKLELFNKTTNPVTKISEEIESEKDDHQFYFEVSGANLTVSGLDVDSKGLPLGLSSNWTTGAASTGKIQITLKHKPGGIKAAGDPVSKGETDIEIPNGGFILKVQ
jgi:hypothetical protein